MKTEEIIEGNKLIAEFMYPKAKEEYASGEIDITDGIYKKSILIFGNIDLMKYNSSWDWLIPVINKITAMSEYFKYKDYTSSMVSEGGIYINTKFIENTWGEVVEFIKYYNENK